MESRRPERAQRARANTLRTVGVLNIVFGLLLVLCVPCFDVYIYFVANAGNLMEFQNRTVTGAVRSAQARRLENLAQREKTATTGQEKAQIRAERADVLTEMQPQAAMPGLDDLSKSMMSQRVLGFYVADLVTSLLLNLGMAVAGIGLLRTLEWARRLAIWVAALKIARLVIVTVCLMAIVSPITRKAMVQSFLNDLRETAKVEGPTAKTTPEQAAAELERALKIGSLCYALGLLVAGSIYPAVSLWLLSSARPSVKASDVEDATNSRNEMT